MSTVLGVVVIGALLLGLEIWTFLNKKPHDTISETVWKSTKLPLIPLLIGILLGHLFWPPRAYYEILEKVSAAGCFDYTVEVTCVPVEE